jgi:glycosyltransferase involved in cell wall biosynthesis
MRILVTADPYIPVPPMLYGGIERAIDVLVRGLASRGHEVTLLAHPESTAPVRRLGYGVPPHFGTAPRVLEWWQAVRTMWSLHRSVDVIHSFGRLAALLPFLPQRSLPKVQSWQRDVIPWSSVGRAEWLAGASIAWTTCAPWMMRMAPPETRRDGWTPVYNPVDTAKYTAVRSVADDAPLVFLGRVEREKGPHTAIAVARAAGRRLVIAGPHHDDGDEGAFWRDEVAPHIDGEMIRYVGAVGDVEKNALLGRAAALLMLVTLEEPFGIVMAEALACGTPVIGFRRGAVPDVVRDGVTGFVVDDIAAATAAVTRLPQLDRAACRADAQSRFSADVIVDEYLAVYERVIAATRAGGR